MIIYHSFEQEVTVIESIKFNFDQIPEKEARVLGQTSHLMNIVRMLLRRPETVQTMLVCDIERQTRNVWRANDLVDEDAVASIHNATSMTPREIVQWVQGTPLFTAIIITLEGRGVNTSVLIGSVLAELGYEENGNE